MYISIRIIGLQPEPLRLISALQAQATERVNEHPRTNKIPSFCHGGNPAEIHFKSVAENIPKQAKNPVKLAIS